MGKVILSLFTTIKGFIKIRGYISHLSMSGQTEFIKKLFLCLSDFSLFNSSAFIKSLQQTH